MESETLTTMQQELIDYCFSHFPKSIEHPDRVETPWGNKTRLGLLRTLERVMTEKQEVSR